MDVNAQLTLPGNAYLIKKFFFTLTHGFRGQIAKY